MLVRSGEIPSPRQTSLDKTYDCAMKYERGALVRGSDPPSGHSVHKTTGDTRRAPARCPIKTHLGAGATKIFDPAPMANNDLFASLGEERRTPRATSHPLDHGPT